MQIMRIHGYSTGLSIFKWFAVYEKVRWYSGIIKEGLATTLHWRAAARAASRRASSPLSFDKHTFHTGVDSARLPTPKTPQVQAFLDHSLLLIR
jgi:hypothetical protein